MAPRIPRRQRQPLRAVTPFRERERLQHGVRHANGRCGCNSNDPNSAASRISASRQTSNAENDLSFLDAFQPGSVTFYTAENNRPRLVPGEITCCSLGDTCTGGGSCGGLADQGPRRPLNCKRQSVALNGCLRTRRRDGEYAVPSLDGSRTQDLSALLSTKQQGERRRTFPHRSLARAHSYPYSPRAMRSWPNASSHSHGRRPHHTEASRWTLATLEALRVTG